MSRRLINLLEETEKFLRFYNKTLSDIKFVFGNDYRVSVDNFVEIAKDTYYDAALGIQEIAKDLILFGKDFYATRYEYEETEGWEYIPMPFNIPEETVRVEKLKGGMWKTLKQINEEDNEEDINKELE